MRKPRRAKRHNHTEEALERLLKSARLYAKLVRFSGPEPAPEPKLKEVTPTNG